MREAGCVSFSTAIIEHHDQKQLEGEGFISSHRLQSITEGSTVGNQDPGDRSSETLEKYCLLPCCCLFAQHAFL